MNPIDFENCIDPSFSGCILITSKGETLFQKSCGYSDLANKISNRHDTRFATASAGKVFVAVAVLKLIENGSLDFDSTIGDLLDLDWKGIDRKITVKQLLTHTSGIPDYFDESVMKDYSDLWRDYPNYRIRTSADLIPFFIDKPRMFPAGSRFQYNNTGYAVLGLIIEKITGKPFDRHLHETVFMPCGMYDTGYYELDRLPERCANAYLFDEASGEYHTNIYSVEVKGTGAGGAFTTVHDVHLFWEKLLSGALISNDMLEEMLFLQASDGEAYYGYGIWLVRTAFGKFTPYFQGCDPGVSFISSYDTEKDFCITVVSNFECNVWQVRRNILKLLLA